jgi:hypothetical protein
MNKRLRWLLLLAAIVFTMSCFAPAPKLISAVLGFQAGLIFGYVIMTWESRGGHHEMITQPEEKQATHIEVELKDGTIFRANGDRAAKIWSWLLAAETQFCIHGAKFSGDGFEVQTGPIDFCRHMVVPFWNTKDECTSETCHRPLPCSIHDVLNDLPKPGDLAVEEVSKFLTDHGISASGAICKELVRIVRGLK